MFKFQGVHYSELTIFQVDFGNVPTQYTFIRAINSTFMASLAIHLTLWLILLKTISTKFPSPHSAGPGRIKEFNDCPTYLPFDLPPPTGSESGAEQEFPEIEAINPNIGSILVLVVVGALQCSGTLVSSSLILTAAHCLHDVHLTNSSSIRMYRISNDENIRGDGKFGNLEEIGQARKFVVHPHFTNLFRTLSSSSDSITRLMEIDIASISLQSPVLNYTSHLTVNSDTRFPSAGSAVRVAGFSSVSTLSLRARQADVALADSRAQCMPSGSNRLFREHISCTDVSHVLHEVSSDCLPW